MKTGTEQALNPDETPEQRLNVYPIPNDMQHRLAEAFTFHPPRRDQLDRYHAIRQEGLLLALRIVQSTPASREQSLALTKLEEVVMWANAAIARWE
ncbi:Acb2/Tad1 domain-containing protein [Anaeromyxobacter oryzisoli]|uniref:Acb2/Tad1 domain-containing protein n=1 Tax=Anaeromyxobacter oryzisoli TaxID=2925408 RepID=UPI001F58CBDE|nr:hypothetical protein [Anaeromyxobacter sp. SG63]